MKMIKSLLVLLFVTISCQSQTPNRHINYYAQDFGLYYLLKNKTIESVNYDASNNTMIFYFTDKTKFEIHSYKYDMKVNF